MKLDLKKLIVLALVVCFLAIFTPFSFSQEQSLQENYRDGAEVELVGEPLFKIRSSIGPFSPEVRAQATSDRIEAIAKDLSIEVSSLQLDRKPQSTNILINNQIIATVTEDDAKAAGQPRQKLARDNIETIKAAIQQYRKERTSEYLILRSIYALVSTLTLIALLITFHIVFPRINARLDRWRETRIPALRIQSFELIPAHVMTDIFIGLANFIRLTMVVGLFLIYTPLVLSFFPWTKRFGTEFFRYSWVALQGVWHEFVAYLPNLLIIILIIVVTHYLLRFLRFLFTELGQSSLFPWFYPEWATPTYKISLVLVIALALVIAYPYFPGFQSPAFQGVSIFLGVLLSLGSTAAVANIVAGVILIYTRAFQEHDRIKIADVVGDVIEKNLLVTRVITPKNVIITIPNAAVLTGNVINYSASIRDVKRPLILNTTVTLGYDVSWPKVHEALVAAAVATEHILADPHPFVLQTSLDDFFVSYELNAYTDNPNLMPKTYSALHQNIQNQCNEVGIEILSPHYSAIRDGNLLAVPEENIPQGYSPPGFRIFPFGNPLNPLGDPKKPSGKQD